MGTLSNAAKLSQKYIYSVVPYATIAAVNKCLSSLPDCILLCKQVMLCAIASNIASTNMCVWK